MLNFETNLEKGSGLIRGHHQTRKPRGMSAFQADIFPRISRELAACGTLAIDRHGAALCGALAKLLGDGNSAEAAARLLAATPAHGLFYCHKCKMRAAPVVCTAQDASLSDEKQRLCPLCARRSLGACVDYVTELQVDVQRVAFLLTAAHPQLPLVTHPSIAELSSTLNKQCITKLGAGSPKTLAEFDELIQELHPSVLSALKRNNTYKRFNPLWTTSGCYIERVVMDCLGCFDPFQQYVLPTIHPSDIAMMFVCTHLNGSAFTGLHVDWLEAVNIAFAIPTLNGEVLMHALAVWMFIMPWALEAAGAAAVEMGRLLHDKKRWTPDDMFKLQELPNFKIAADGSVAAHFPAYVEAVDSVLIPFFVHDDVRLALAQDYGEVSCRAVLGLLRQYF
ncbi:hypothetical protein ACK3TF_005796 [Chlorella vulgaris]